MVRARSQYAVTVCRYERQRCALSTWRRQHASSELSAARSAAAETVLRRWMLGRLIEALSTWSALASQQRMLWWTAALRCVEGSARTAWIAWQRFAQRSTALWILQREGSGLHRQRTLGEAMKTWMGQAHTAIVWAGVHRLARLVLSTRRWRVHANGMARLAQSRRRCAADAARTHYQSRLSRSFQTWHRCSSHRSSLVARSAVVLWRRGECVAQSARVCHRGGAAFDPAKRRGQACTRGMGYRGKGAGVEPNATQGRSRGCACLPQSRVRRAHLLRRLCTRARPPAVAVAKMVDVRALSVQDATVQIRSMLAHVAAPLARARRHPKPACCARDLLDLVSRMEALATLAAPDGAQACAPGTLDALPRMGPVATVATHDGAQAVISVVFSSAHRRRGCGLEVVPVRCHALVGATRPTELKSTPRYVIRWGGSGWHADSPTTPRRAILWVGAS